MVNLDSQWGTVCDNGFTLTSAKAACYTLGFSGGSYSWRSKETNMKSGDSVDSDLMKIWLDNVQCTSETSHFYAYCSYRTDPPKSNCNGHWKDVFLFCD